MDNSLDIDSKDIPSLGYPTRGQKKVTVNRDLAVWIYRLILKTVTVHPDIEELKKICERQDIVIEKQNQVIQQSSKFTNKLEAKILILEEQIKELDIKTAEYRNWENQIRQHISSVDEKAGSIEQLRSLIYALWDVTVQTVEPDVEKAEFLVKSFRHLISMGPEKRTRNSKIVDSKRWIDEKV